VTGIVHHAVKGRVAQLVDPVEVRARVEVWVLDTCDEERRRGEVRPGAIRRRRKLLGKRAAPGHRATVASAARRRSPARMGTFSRFSGGGYGHS
jgi:hypothetical protein